MELTASKIDGDDRDAPVPYGSAGSRDRICGTGEMATLTRGFDWSQTPVGPAEQWPNTLLVVVNMLLGSRHPMFLLWGEELVQFYNDAFRPSIGADKHPKALGQRGVECWPEIWHMISPQIDAVMTHGVAAWNEDQLVPIYRNGTLEDVYWIYSYSPVRDPDGGIRGTVVICSDTTGRVMAERQLRSSQEQYKALFELASEAIIIADVNGRITEVNRAACQLLGYSRSELVRRNYAEVVAGTEVRRLWKARDALLKGGISVEEWKLVASNGSGIVAEVSATILPDGRWQAMVRDITERKRLELERAVLLQELHQERSRLADLFQQAPAFFALLRGPEHIFEMTNPLYQELIGHRSVIGKTVREAVPETEEQGFFALLDRVYQTGERFVGRGTRISLARSGGQPLEERYLDFVYQPMREPDGAMYGVIVLGVDVTERKRAGAALMQTEKLAAVGRLAASIAHEINNPLESVTNLLYLARASSDLPEVQDYLETAERELRRVSAITNQTLRFHKQSARPSLVNCQELMEGILGIYQSRIVNSHVSVEKRKRASKPVLCFEGEIRQVLDNLIANAIDAMQPEGGRLLLRSREATHWKTGRRGLMLTVADTGAGIDPQIFDRIFEAFFTTKGYTGTGLGLWVSQEIVVRHAGALQVRSSRTGGRRGTVFALFLPFDAASRS